MSLLKDLWGTASSAYDEAKESVTGAYGDVVGLFDTEDTEPEPAGYEQQAAQAASATGQTVPTVQTAQSNTGETVVYTTTTNNTPLYITGGVILVVLLVLAIIMMRGK